jgi:hypothetical protein
MTADPMPLPAVPEPAMIAAYAKVVFGYCEGWVPVRALPEHGAPDQPPHTPFLEANGDLATRLAVQAAWAAEAGMALFVVPGTVAAPGEAKAGTWPRPRWCWSTSTAATLTANASISSATSVPPAWRWPQAA